MADQAGALNPGYALARIMSDLAEATQLFSELDTPVEEYLALVERLHDDASTVISMVFAAMTDGVRAKIPDDVWDAHAKSMVERQSSRTPEERDKQISSVLRRLSEYDVPEEVLEEMKRRAKERGDDV